MSAPGKAQEILSVKSELSKAEPAAQNRTLHLGRQRTE